MRSEPDASKPREARAAVPRVAWPPEKPVVQPPIHPAGPNSPAFSPEPHLDDVDGPSSSRGPGNRPRLTRWGRYPARGLDIAVVVSRVPCRPGRTTAKGVSSPRAGAPGHQGPLTQRFRDDRAR
jgi:hypothetical protein